MKKFKISEIKEQGIWVKCSGQNALRLIQAFDYEQYRDYTAEPRIGKFYRWNGDGFDWDYNILMTKTSYIDFSQIDWEERKQIGWKLKKECEQYRKAALKISNSIHFLVHNVNGIFTQSKEEELLRKAGVLELWFDPVYEEVKYKVGDWVTVTNPKSTDRCDLTIGQTFQIKQIMGEENPEKAFIRSNLVINGDIRFNGVRHATAEEIKAAEKIEIGGHPVEFRNGATEIDGFEFSKADWEAALRVSLNPKAKIKVGCSHQFDLPTETIERILSKLK